MSINKRKPPFIGEIQAAQQSQATHHANFYRGRHVFIPVSERVQILNLNNVSDTAWTDKNISANVSSDAFAAFLLLAFYDTASATVNTFAKFRENGSSHDGSAFVQGGHLNSVFNVEQAIVPLDANKVFEYNIEASGANTATLHVYLVGYYSKIT